MGFMTQAFFNETGRTLFCYQLTSIDWISTFWMMGEGEDRSQSLFYFVPQEKNLTAKQAQLFRASLTNLVYCLPLLLPSCFISVTFQKQCPNTLPFSSATERQVTCFKVK